MVFHADQRRAAHVVAELTRYLGGEPETATSLTRTAGAAAPAAAHLSVAVDQLAGYFDGVRKEFTIPLDWSLSSGFQRQVLRELVAHVRYGTVVGYQHLADRVGEPGAARAVGAAMGANPLPVVVPCHRVVSSDGDIGGFGGGLDTKRALLALEGVLPAPLF